MTRPRRVTLSVLLLAFAVLLAAACGSATETKDDSPVSPEATATAAPTPTLTSAPEVKDTATPDTSPIETTVTSPTSLEGRKSLMDQLLHGTATPGHSNVEEAISAVQQVLASGDSSFVPVLHELLALPLTRVGLSFNRDFVLPALEELTGQSFGYDIRAWTEWLGRQDDITVPEGFVGWKGEFFSKVDRRFKDFFVDKETGQPFSGDKVKLDVTQIAWGGVLKDDGTGLRSIPALVNPAMTTPELATYLLNDDRVFGISINGDSRAYPLRIMNAHEMFNDMIGGLPVALAYCTLCGAGILYDTTVDGTVYIFRTSGLLYKSNKLMYDTNTNTIWNQFTGEPVLGELADSGIKLEILPVTITTWSDWRASHPDTTVLSITTGYQRSYAPEGDPNAVYTEYFARPVTMFPVPERDDRLETKAVVYGLQINGATRAYAVDRLKEEPVVNDSLEGVNVVLVTNPETGAVRVYERVDLTFSSMREEDGVSLVSDDRGEDWRVEESALVNVSDLERRLERISGHAGFWFAWYAFHPDTTIYGDEG